MSSASRHLPPIVFPALAQPMTGPAFPMPLPGNHFSCQARLTQATQKLAQRSASYTEMSTRRLRDRWHARGLVRSVRYLAREDYIEGLKWWDRYELAQSYGVALL